MCGIYGYEGVATGEDRRVLADFLRKAAAAMDTRGGDSWGWATQRMGVFNLRKGMGEAILSPDGGVVPAGYERGLGHTRFGTVGRVVTANAHPFVYGNVVGAHNGSISNYDRELHDCDSATLIKAIHDMTAERSNGIHTLHGWGAVVWINTDDEATYACRMMGGSLEFANLELLSGRCVLVYASVLPEFPGLRRLPQMQEGVVYGVVEGGKFDFGLTIDLQWPTQPTRFGTWDEDEFTCFGFDAYHLGTTVEEENVEYGPECGISDITGRVVMPPMELLERPRKSRKKGGKK